MMDRVYRDDALGKSQFHDRLRDWLARTDEFVIGPDGIDGRTPWIYVRDGSNLYVLHADTPRNAVQAYLQLVAQFGDGIEWEIAESQRGKMTAVVYGPQKIRLRSFYLYAAGAGTAMNRLRRDASSMKALVIKREPMKKILGGSKSWEIRRGRCHIRGLIGLIESGSGTVVGTAQLVACVGPLTRKIRIHNARKMGITAKTAAEAWPRGLYAWVLKNRRRLPRSVPYKHPAGVIRWVPLATKVRNAVLKQMH